MTEEEIKKLVADTVKQTLTQLGIEQDKPLEYQKDMAFVRSWRTSSEAVKRQSMLTATGIIITGFIALIWLAIKG